MDSSVHSGVAASHVVIHILRALLETLIKCPLCDRIYKEAATIHECMHTFCNECIYHRIQMEGITSCPTCNVDLSHLALEDYLRPDEAWRGIVNEYLCICSRNEQGEAPQATPPPAIADTTSDSTAQEET